ncbi:hypothetical protein MNBD_ACTINO02-2508, partial [hydrothermal vent metagenome]
WSDTDSVGLAPASWVHETGSTCDSVRAKIRVKENGSWVTRQNTDSHFGSVRGYDATEFAWAEHDGYTLGTWHVDHQDH